MSRVVVDALPPPGALGALVTAAGARAGRFVVAARGGDGTTYAGLPAVCAAWAHDLDERGVPANGRVLVRIADPVTCALALLGIAAAGRTAVPVDPRAPEADIARTLRVSAADLAMADAEHAGPGFAPLTVTAAPAGTAPFEIRPGGGIALATSGSTGAPKLVRLDERQLVYVATMVARHNGLTADDRGYNPLPLFHINAEVVALLATLVAGGTLVLDARFRRTGFFELLREQRITWVNGVPAIWSILSGEPAPGPLPALRFVRSASAPLPAAVRGWVADALRVPVVESYGMTEAASQITATPLDGSAPAGSVGRGVGTEIEVREAGRSLPAGERGRVWIRGPGVVTAYADTPDAPASRYADRFDEHGWLDTGDVGQLDPDGFLTLTGRADDVVNRGGELVHPREVEEVLHEDRRIRDAVVVGRPDDVLGEVPVAFLVLQPEHAAEADDVVAAAVARCEQALSAFKRPVEITVAADLPRASTGKIKRHEVRAVSGPTSPTAAKKRRAHVHEIDVVRVLTFACVIAVHTVANVNPTDLVWPNAVLMIVHFTRSAFFALTGFVLTYQYLGRPVRVKNFWRRRLTLVGVPYVTWSVLYTALDQVDHPAATVGAFVQKLLLNLAVGDAWYHLYFLLVSMQIYLLFPLIQWLVEKTRGHHVALLVVSAVLQFGVLAAIRYGDPGPGFASHLVTYSDTVFVSYQFYILAGAVAATRLEELRTWIPAHARGIALAVLATALVTEGFFAAEVGTGMPADLAASVLQPAMFPWSAAATAGLLALGVLWSRSHAADSTQARWLRTASDRSFGVFLVHPAVLWVVVWLAGDALVGALTGPGATALVYVVVVVGAVAFTELARHTPVSMPLTGRPPLAEVDAPKRAERTGPTSPPESPQCD